MFNPLHDYAKIEKIQYNHVNIYFSERAIIAHISVLALQKS